MKHLRPDVWQWAWREEHLPNVGDSQVYDVGPNSAAVIQGAVKEVGTFVDACLHRGKQFADSDSSGSGKQFIPRHVLTWMVV